MPISSRRNSHQSRFKHWGLISAAITATLVSLVLGGCESGLLGYLAKQGMKQGGLILKARDIDEVLANPNNSSTTERYLRLTQKIVAYARDHLNMNTGRSYRKFIQLDRDWVTQIVIAAQRDRLEPYLFHYPIVGDLPYKGYFDEADAIELQDKLEKDGLDTYRRKVPAYSTTGFLPDPIISTMFDGEARFIELLFHELTHSTFYFKSEADFNEAFASWMGFRSALEFIDASPEIEHAADLKKELQADHLFQLKFAKVVRDIFKRAPDFYGEKELPGASVEKKREAFFAWIRSQLGSDPDFARMNKLEWNNAFLLGLGTYYEKVEPIDSYAQREKLSPKDFLVLVKEKGPSIINVINGPSTAQ